jgi:hypothetical protein
MSSSTARSGTQPGESCLAAGGFWHQALRIDYVHTWFSELLAALVLFVFMFGVNLFGACWSCNDSNNSSNGGGQYMLAAALPAAAHSLESLALMQVGIRAFGSISS